MSKPIKAVYPGTFDPITNGHLDVIARARSLFPELVVAVYDHPLKKALFSITERMKFIKKSLGKEKQHVVIDSFSEELLVDYCRKKSITVVVRGLRAVTDFEYEFQMDHINQLLNQKLETVFFMTSHQYSYLSSSVVKEIARLGGDVCQFVPQPVVQALHNVFSTKGYHG